MSWVRCGTGILVLGGGGCTLIFSYIHRPGLFLGVKNFEFQYFWGVFRKMIIFGL